MVMSVRLRGHLRGSALERTRPAEHAVLEHIRKRHGGEKHLDLASELFPEIVGETTARAAKAAL